MYEETDRFPAWHLELLGRLGGNLEPVRAFGENVLLLADPTGSACLLRRLNKGVGLDAALETAEFADFLREKGICTPAVRSLHMLGDRVIELQEYMPGAEDLVPEPGQLRALARMHDAAAEYAALNPPSPGEDTAFRKKYHDAFRNNFNAPELCAREKRMLLDLHRRVFLRFMELWDGEVCLIHNGLERRGLILTGEGYGFLDFDRRCRGPVCVDAVELILARAAPEDMRRIFGPGRRTVIRLLEAYNRRSRRLRLNFRLFALMTALAGCARLSRPGRPLRREAYLCCAALCQQALDE